MWNSATIMMIVEGTFATIYMTLLSTLMAYVIGLPIGVALVVTPLIALMKDQVQNLADRGIKALAVYTGMTRREVELAGLVSYLCVLSNAIMVKAALPEAEIIVDASCTAGPDPALHAKGLDVMEALQITVLNR